MSYILEALRKAERERAGSAVPSTATEHQLPAPPARPRWPWVLGAALVLNVLLAAGLIAILRQPGRPGARRDYRQGYRSQSLHAVKYFTIGVLAVVVSSCIPT